MKYSRTTRGQEQRYERKISFHLEECKWKKKRSKPEIIFDVTDRLRKEQVPKAWAEKRGTT